MSPEQELEIWRAAWRSAKPAAPLQSEFLAAHRRQERRVRAGYILNLVAAVLLILLAVFVVRNDFGPESVLWAAVVVLSTAAATAFHIRNWRPLWGTGGCSVTEFADIYEKRCMAALRAARFAGRLLVVQVAISAPWLTWDWTRGSIPPSRYAFAMGLLSALSLFFILQVRRSRGRALAELRQVDEFRRSLRD